MIQIDLMMAGVIAGIVASVLTAGVVGYSRLLLALIERRAGARHKELSETITAHNHRLDQFEREWLTWRADLPLNYVRREDYIRGQSVVEAKLDALAAKVEIIQLQSAPLRGFHER